MRNASAMSVMRNYEMRNTKNIMPMGLSTDSGNKAGLRTGV